MNATRVSVLVSRTPHSLASLRFRASRLVPHPRVGDDSGGELRHRGRCQTVPRPIALPLYQPGALVKCFSSRIMTRSARLWPPLSFSRSCRRSSSILCCSPWLRVSRRSVARFFFFLFLSLFFCLTLLSSPCRRGQTLLLPQPPATTSSRTREEAAKLLLFLAVRFLAIYVYP